MPWNYQEEVERKIDRIRSMALIEAQQINPDISYVIDKYSFDDYCEKTWEYPGTWYCSFRLPNGVESELELIDIIARETVAYFSKR